jgi:hypothetical protein
MKYPIWLRSGVALVAATLVSSLFFAEASPGARGVRGQPIRPVAPKGEPIRPSTPAAEPGAKPDSAAVEGDAGKVETSAGEVTGKGNKDYLRVGFDRLASFEYLVPEYTGLTPPPSPNTNQIPTGIKGFDGRSVALRGFMLPLKVENGKVTELLLMRDQSMCCFGTVPKINEFVTVKMVGGGIRAIMDQAVTLFGTLKVGEFTENGYLMGIYQMDGEHAEGPES